MRLVNADLRIAYAEYLWDFAFYLHMDAHTVNQLRCIDFYHYAMGIEAHKEQEKKRAEAQANAGM